MEHLVYSDLWGLVALVSCCWHSFLADKANRYDMYAHPADFFYIVDHHDPVSHSLY